MTGKSNGKKIWKTTVLKLQVLRMQNKNAFHSKQTNKVPKQNKPNKNNHTKQTNQPKPTNQPSQFGFPNNEPLILHNAGHQCSTHSYLLHK